MSVLLVEVVRVAVSLPVLHRDSRPLAPVEEAW